MSIFKTKVDVDFYHSENKLVITAVRFFIFINISKCIFAVRGCVPGDE